MTRFALATPMHVLLEGFLHWVMAGKCLIATLRGLIPLVMNKIQKRLWRLMYTQAVAGRPVRIVLVKSRKKGVSTLIQAFIVYCCIHVSEFSAATVAHRSEDVDELAEIAHRILRYQPSEARPATENGAQPIGWPNGSWSRYDTAGGKDLLSGSTNWILHLSEPPKYREDKQSIELQMASMLDSVPFDSPATMIILESSPNKNNLNRDFEKRFRRAWEAERAGTPTDWRPFFSPWFEDDEATQPVPPDFEPTEYEQRFIREFGITPGNCMWRRNRVEDHNGDESMVMQEFPGTIDEAFQRSEGRVFPNVSPERHDRRIDLADMKAGKWNFYRGHDFGGTDPEVCIWVAHLPGPVSELTIDAQACPNLWREVIDLGYDRNGKPRDENNHATDALRYVLTHFYMTGRAHAFREYYDAKSAARGMTEIKHAQAIRRMQRDLPATLGVAPRERPMTINTYTQQGVHCQPYGFGGVLSGRGEILDGIAHMNSMFGHSGSILPQQETAAITDAELIQRAIDRGMASPDEWDAMLRNPTHEAVASPAAGRWDHLRW